MPLNASELVEPTPEIISQVKQSYNSILKRCNEACKYLDNPEVSQKEKDLHTLAFRAEIIDPLESYLRVLQDWNVNVEPNEIVNGFNL